MKLVESSIKFKWITPNVLENIERIGRVCYKSERKISPGSAEKFVKMLLSKEHEAMIEHASASYTSICPRGVSHEIVRHRIASYAQESTRYCDYSGGVAFIIPPWLNLLPGDYHIEDMNRYFHEKEQIHPDWPTRIWLAQMYGTEVAYRNLIEKALYTPQKARGVLTIDLKTEITMTYNMREWRLFMKLRTAKAAHPQMREVAFMILKDLQDKVPVLFDEYSVNL